MTRLNVRFNSINQEMDALHIPAENHPSVFFFPKIGKARKAACKISLQCVSLDSFLIFIKSVILYDKDV